VWWIRIGFNAGTDPAFNLNADPDSASQTNADPKPGQTFPSKKGEFVTVPATGHKIINIYTYVGTFVAVPGFFYLEAGFFYPGYQIRIRNKEFNIFKPKNSY
jgi:hypothetical protein